MASQAEIAPPAVPGRSVDNAAAEATTAPAGTPAAASTANGAGAGAGAITDIPKHAKRVHRECSKQNGEYTITAVYLVMDAESDEAAHLKVSVYCQSSSQKHTVELKATQLISILQGSSLSQSSVPAELAELPDLQPHVAALPSEPAMRSKAFYKACVAHIMDTAMAQVALAAKQAVAEAAVAARTSGDAERVAKEYTRALEHYTRAVTLDPGNLTHRLARAGVLLEMDSCDDAIHDYKKVVASARKLAAKARKSSHDADEMAITGGVGSTTIVAQAYASIGEAYEKKGVTSRAMNAYTLSLRAKHDDGVRAKMSACLQAAADAAGATMAKAADIEDVVSRHSLIGLQDNFKFECTGCGECCRSADHIFLTPADLFRMSRAPNMQLQGVTTTTELRAKFGDAMFFTTRDYVPLCELRPIKSSAGQCHFAFPLFKHGEDGHVLSYQEVNQEALEPYTRVEAWEYNLTEEDEAEARREMQERAQMEADGIMVHAESDGDDSSDNELGGPDDDGHNGDETAMGTGAGAGAGAGAGDDASATEPVIGAAKPEPEVVLNSYNRQALGCMFGMESMPTLCSSYPIARELSWADFWHEYSDGHASKRPGSVASAAAAAAASAASAGAGTGAGAGDTTVADVGDAKSAGTAIAASHEDAEQYVVVRTDECEGFFEDGKARTDVFIKDPASATEQSLAQFIAGNGVQTRWREHDWFIGIINAFVRSGVVKALRAVSPKLANVLVQRMCGVWFDFDSLSELKGFNKSATWSKVQGVVSTASSRLMRAAQDYVSKLDKHADVEKHILDLRANLKSLKL